MNLWRVAIVGEISIVNECVSMLIFIYLALEFYGLQLQAKTMVYLLMNVSVFFIEVSILSWRGIYVPLMLCLMLAFKTSAQMLQ